MPVRKIPKNYLSVTGGFASRKNQRMVGFESPLEKDYMIQLEYEDEVEGFEEQPILVPVAGGKGSAGKYVPDLLVRYRPGANGVCRKPVLAEIKSSRDLKKNKKKYAPKFAAAKLLAADRGWEFLVVDEKKIRTPRLAFLKFLREYHCIQPEPQDMARVVSVLGEMGGRASYARLIDRLCKSDAEKLCTIPVVWHLVATRRIVVNLDCRRAFKRTPGCALNFTQAL